MIAAGQTEFPFVSLDFPGRSTLMLGEIATRIGVTRRHLANEIERGALVALDLRGSGTSRLHARVPIEAYRDYVCSRITAPWAQRIEFLKQLPRPTLIVLAQEINALIAA